MIGTYLYCIWIGQDAEFHLCVVAEDRLLEGLESLQCPIRVGITELVELQLLCNRCSRHSSAISSLWRNGEIDHHRPAPLTSIFSLKKGFFSKSLTKNLTWQNPIPPIPYMDNLIRHQMPSNGTAMRRKEIKSFYVRTFKPKFLNPIMWWECEATGKGLSVYGIRKHRIAWSGTSASWAGLSRVYGACSGQRV